MARTAPPSRGDFPDVEPDPEIGSIDALTELELALGNRRVTTTESLTADGDDVDDFSANHRGVATTHSRPRKVRLYKPGDGGSRAVPSGNLRRLTDPTDGGWSIVCPKCHSRCGGSPWGCGKEPEPPFWECPVPDCNADRPGSHPKRFYETRPRRQREENKNRLRDETLDLEISTAKTKLYEHIWTFHPSYAAAARIPRREV